VPKKLFRSALMKPKINGPLPGKERSKNTAIIPPKKPRKTIFKTSNVY